MRNALNAMRLNIETLCSSFFLGSGVRIDMATARSGPLQIMGGVMKNLKVLLASLLIVPVLAFASEPTASNEMTPEIQQQIEASGQTSGAINPDQSSEQFNTYTCTAWTQCLNGRVISCNATGLACRSNVTQGASVFCQAWGTNGSYSQASDYCY